MRTMVVAFATAVSVAIVIPVMAPQQSTPSAQGQAGAGQAGRAGGAGQPGGSYGPGHPGHPADPAPTVLKSPKCSERRL